MTQVSQKVIETIESSLDSLNFNLYDLEYVQEGQNWFLRVAIDKENGLIDLNDCTLASNQLGEDLDALTPDPFPEAYYLEVTSPGAERELLTEAQLQASLGEYIHIDFKEPIDGQFEFAEGTLKEITEDQLSLEVKDKTRKKVMSFDRDNISLIRLAISF